MKKNLKIPVITFSIMVALILALFGLYMLMAYFMEESLTAGARTPEEQAKEIAAEKQFFPKLDELYIKGDYDGLLELANSEEAGNLDLWNYENYDFLRFYGKYSDIKNTYIPALDSGKLAIEDARRFTEYIFEYYYRSYDPNLAISVKMVPEDVAYFDSVREEYILGILYDRMDYTKSDMDAVKDDIMDNGYFHSNVADKYSDKYYGRYK